MIQVQIPDLFADLIDQGEDFGWMVSDPTPTGGIRVTIVGAKPEVVTDAADVLISENAHLGWGRHEHSVTVDMPDEKRQEIDVIVTFWEPGQPDEVTIRRRVRELENPL